jgi:hypothetical protein
MGNSTYSSLHVINYASEQAERRSLKFLLMIKHTIENLERETQLELNRITVQIHDPLERLSQCLLLVQGALQKLKHHIKEHSFKDQQEEIYFFKKVKPGFYCLMIYTTEMYTIETGIPIADKQNQRNFLKNELRYIERYLNKYAFQYQYYKFNATELDHLYFIRNVKDSSILVPNVPDLDPEFSTACDYLFSKFKAFDMLKEWLNEKLAYGSDLYNVGLNRHGENAPDDLRWTGDTINLAELGYALYFTGQLNNGSAGVAQIFRWLEDKLKVNIGVPAKRFAEIRGRKRLSRTKYIDDMKEGILRKLDREEGYNPDHH